MVHRPPAPAQRARHPCVRRRQAARRPRPGLTSYKLSSNENPYPPLPGVLEAATEAAAQMNRYPDMGSTALYAALGEAMGVPVEDLAAATGSVGPDLPARQRLLRARRRGRLRLALLRGLPDRRHRRRRDAASRCR